MSFGYTCRFVIGGGCGAGDAACCPIAHGAQRRMNKLTVTIVGHVRLMLGSFFYSRGAPPFHRRGAPPPRLLLRAFALRNGSRLPRAAVAYAPDPVRCSPFDY